MNAFLKLSNRECFNTLSPDTSFVPVFGKKF